MDLAKLTTGLAAIKQGLNDLDTEIRQELASCSALNKQIAAVQYETQQMQMNTEEVKQHLHGLQCESADLEALLGCIKQQTEHAGNRKQLMQDDIKDIRKKLEDLVNRCESQSDAFCTAYGHITLQQQEAAAGQDEHKMEGHVKSALQDFQAAKKRLQQQRAAIKDIRQQVATDQLTNKELKELLDGEAAESTELAARIEVAKHTGPAAQQLAQHKQEIAERENELLQLQCCVAAQEVELGQAGMLVRQRHQEVARKRSKLAELNRTIQALGLTPVGEVPWAAPSNRAQPAGAQPTRPACHSSSNQPQVRQPGTYVGQAGAAASLPPSGQHPQASWAKRCALRHGSLPGVQQQQWQHQRPHDVSPSSHPAWCTQVQPNGDCSTPHQGDTIQQVQQPALAQQQQQQEHQQQWEHQQQQQQPQPPQQLTCSSYYVEEPDESKPQRHVADTSAYGLEVSPAVVQQAQAADELLTANKSSSGKRSDDSLSPDGACGRTAETQPRKCLVVSETVVTQTMLQNQRGASAAVTKRMVVQEVQEAHHSRSGTRVIPKNRTVVIKTIEQNAAEQDAAGQHQQNTPVLALSAAAAQVAAEMSSAGAADGQRATAHSWPGANGAGNSAFGSAASAGLTSSRRPTIHSTDAAEPSVYNAPLEPTARMQEPAEAAGQQPCAAGSQAAVLRHNSASAAAACPDHQPLHHQQQHAWWQSRQHEQMQQRRRQPGHMQQQHIQQQQMQNTKEHLVPLHAMVHQCPQGPTPAAAGVQQHLALAAHWQPSANYSDIPQHQATAVGTTNHVVLPARRLATSTGQSDIRRSAPASSRHLPILPSRQPLSAAEQETSGRLMNQHSFAAHGQAVDLHYKEQAHVAQWQVDGPIDGTMPSGQAKRSTGRSAGRKKQAAAGARQGGSKKHDKGGKRAQAAAAVDMAYDADDDGFGGPGNNW